jgi:hypothetical protein
MLKIRRIGEESDMIAVPKAAVPPVGALSIAFTRPTIQEVRSLGVHHAAVGEKKAKVEHRSRA